MLCVAPEVLESFSHVPAHLWRSLCSCPFPFSGVDHCFLLLSARLIGHSSPGQASVLSRACEPGSLSIPAPPLHGGKTQLCVCGGSLTGFCFVLVYNPGPERLPTSSWNRYLLLLPFPQKQWAALCLGSGSGRVAPPPPVAEGFCTREGPVEVGRVLFQPPVVACLPSPPRGGSLWPQSS